MDAPLTFLPIDRRHALARGESLPDRTQGTALFADISGFTPLTEALGKLLGQRRGAEELSRHLNRVYDALITEVENYGGSVINFSGDAITCWFDNDLGDRAIASALMMQKAMALHSTFMLPSGGMVMLAMKAAVARGSVRRWVVGDPNIQLLDVLAGATLGRMSVVEHHTNRNEVLATADCYAAVADIAVVLEWRADRDESPGTLYPVIGGLLQPVTTRPWAALPDNVLTEAAMRPWVLPSVYDRLSAGQSDFLAELRPATALFLRFDGIDYDEDPAAEAKLNAYISWTQNEIHRHEGFLLQFTVGDKGSYLYAAFGTPIAHDDDPLRAVAVAQILSAPPPEFNFINNIQIGVNQGRMRAGPYGGTTRRTYGVLGDEVNLAARLMQAAAPGQVLVTASVADPTQAAFQWEALAPIKVKGKTQPVTVFQLADDDPLARRRTTSRFRKEPPSDSTFVGREAERGRMSEALNTLAHQHQSGLIIIEGEAGIGKSRLIEAFRADARQLPVLALSGLGDSIEKAKPYHAWREVFFTLFDWDTLPDLEARQQRALAFIGADRQRLAPLLNAVLPLEFPDNDLTRNLTGKALADSTRELLLHLLQSVATRTPLVLILEDAHWIDTASWALALAAHQRGRTLPHLLVIASRPLSDPPPEFAQLIEAPGLQRLRLMPLPRHDVLTLVCQRLGVGRLPDPMVAIILNKAEGNPLFSEELAYALRDRGLIEIVGAQCWIAPGVDLETAGLPDNVNGVVTSRIDRLAPPQQLALKVASVIGREFALGTLRDVHPVLSDRAHLSDYLESLTRLELMLHDGQTDLAYLFKHNITHEVAYNLMLFAQRRELHHAIAAWYETQFVDRLPQVYPVLAHHWSHAAEGQQTDGASEQARYILDKALSYLTKAGEQAAQISAFREAVAAFERALSLLPSAQTGALGDYANARAELLVKLGNTYEAMSDFRQAADRLRQALALARTMSDNKTAAQALSGLCWVSIRQGAHAEARTLGEEALTLARAADDRATMALALRRLGVVSKGDRPTAIRHYEESLALYRQLGDQNGEAVCMNNLGNIAAGQSDYNGANRYYAEALGLVREVGNRQAIGLFLGNLGEIARRQNNYSAATDYLEEALTILREIDSREGVAATLWNLGDVAVARSDLSAAQRYYHEALAEALAIGALPRALGALAGVAGLHLKNGDPVRAAELAGLALSHPASNAEVKDQAEPVLTAARAALPPETVIAAQARGAARTLEEVAKEILGG